MSLELPDRLQALEQLRELRERIEEITRLAESGPSWQPPYDLLDEGETYRLRIDLPGVRPEDLELLEEGSTLTLGGFRPAADGQYLRRERASGGFRRSLSLPGPIQEGSAVASLREGVLEIVLRKATPERISLSNNPP